MATCVKWLAQIRGPSIQQFCKGFDQVLGSVVTSGKTKPVRPAGGVGESRMALLSPYGHMGELAGENATEERQRSQMKIATPAKGKGKTVAIINVKDSSY